MSALPHSSSRLAIGVDSGILATVASHVAMSMRGFPEQPHRWIPRLVVRLSEDLRQLDRVADAWGVLLMWSVAVTVLHLAGLAFDIYTIVPWWHILTHTMGISGVAALAFLTHRNHPSAWNSVRWLVPTVVAIGSGLEVYEFLFRTFWEYAIDTAVDLGVNTLGAVFVAFGVSLHRIGTDQIQPNPSNMDHSD